MQNAKISKQEGDVQPDNAGLWIADSPALTLSIIQHQQI
jgi:hypothetical protein